MFSPSKLQIKSKKQTRIVSVFRKRRAASCTKHDLDFARGISALLRITQEVTRRTIPSSWTHSKDTISAQQFSLSRHPALAINGRIPKHSPACHHFFMRAKKQIDIPEIHSERKW
ncbi:hypothetical protein AVEN_142264-1 [Araneus ventricosus]|uniref:Uncharacterized protein n=1 Tax=Araneus ventricosus TaxID=182803 RepID=A0A4Y2QXG9_ARAVE|nr:hypothetical protein AVEN_142264-1 [Araneus ventricosus]